MVYDLRPADYTTATTTTNKVINDNDGDDFEPLQQCRVCRLGLLPLQDDRNRRSSTDDETCRKTSLF